MFSRISNGEFFIRFLLTLAYLAAIVLFFPTILRTLVPILAGGSCRNAGGGCGALALVLGVYLKPLLILLGIVLTALIAFKRVRGVDSPFWAAFAAATVYTASPFLYVVGNFWGANFSIGLLHVAPPYSLAALLMFGLVLSLNFEDATGFPGRLVAIRGPVGIPSGLLYGVSAAWLCLIACITLLSAMMIHAGYARTVATLIFSSGARWGFHLGAASALNVLAGLLLIIGMHSDRTKGSSVGTGDPRPMTGASTPGAQIDRRTGATVRFGRRMG